MSRYQRYNQVELEEEKLDKLHGKIRLAKGLAGNLRDEIGSHQPYLDELSSGVGIAQNNLQYKDKQLEEIQEDKHLCSIWMYYAIIALQIFIMIFIVASWL